MARPDKKSKLPRLLWIEDDLKYARLLGLELGDRFDFEVHTELSEALSQKLEKGADYDGVVIDMHLAQGRMASQIFQTIRGAEYRGPVFVLSNDESVVSKLEMLALGVDDYLWKVMPTEELALRMGNAIARHRGARLSLEGLELNLDRLTAALHSQPLDLSKLEFKIYLTLFRHHPKPTPLRILKEEVWAGTAVENGTIATFFWKLNKKTQSWGFRIMKTGEEVGLRRVNELRF